MELLDFPRRFSSLVNPVKIAKNIKWRYGASISNSSHVFVVGAPRSGTTLMFTIIGAHPSFASIDCETFFFVPRDNFNLSSYSRLEKNKNIEMRDIEITLEDSKDIVEFYDKLASKILRDEDKVRFLEKTPFHVLYLKYLVKHFPNARFVNMIRDGRDCYRSNKRLADYYHKPLKKATRLWRDSIRARQTMGKHSQIIDVRYEDLTHNPTETLERVMSFLGEDFYPEQLDPATYSKSTIFRGDKGHERLSQPIKPTSIGKWKKDLTSDEIQYFQKNAGKELVCMGYEILD
ncbi:sulfotransferase family protein [Adonisia turfae]|uniref:Sulfotransferase n=1 Tax=Adonisia turfae CCMR0081 TaxID=2292702 RepID=A0A6M0RVW8_9CYAN|nr:sulfotransferase [Adonisia turfae]NEZ59941.1 sulfotransferase [Adonisia turfae CCMR0081]